MRTDKTVDMHIPKNVFKITNKEKARKDKEKTLLELKQKIIVSKKD